MRIGQHNGRIKQGSGADARRNGYKGRAKRRCQGAGGSKAGCIDPLRFHFEPALRCSSLCNTNPSVIITTNTTVAAFGFKIGNPQQGFVLRCWVVVHDDDDDELESGEWRKRKSYTSITLPMFLFVSAEAFNLSRLLHNNDTKY